jgi:hypothetical protein
VSIAPTTKANVDPAVLFQCLHPMMHILYKQELHRIPLMGMAFRPGRLRGGGPRRSPEVDRVGRPGGGVAAPRELVFILSGGHAQARTGELLPFKKGGFIMALQAQVPGAPGSRQRLSGRIDAERQRPSCGRSGDGAESVRRLPPQG